MLEIVVRRDGVSVVSQIVQLLLVKVAVMCSFFDRVKCVTHSTHIAIVQVTTEILRAYRTFLQLKTKIADRLLLFLLCNSLVSTFSSIPTMKTNSLESRFLKNILQEKSTCKSLILFSYNTHRFQNKIIINEIIKRIARLVIIFCCTGHFPFLTNIHSNRNPTVQTR